MNETMAALLCGSITNIILDSDGAGMVEGVKAKPFLIKPNSEELSHLMGRALDSQQELTLSLIHICGVFCFGCGIMQL